MQQKSHSAVTAHHNLAQRERERGGRGIEGETHRQGETDTNRQTDRQRQK